MRPGLGKKDCGFGTHVYCSLTRKRLATQRAFFEQRFCTYHTTLTEHGLVHIALADDDDKCSSGLAGDVLPDMDEDVW
jgi:hypothetical protein